MGGLTDPRGGARNVVPRAGGILHSGTGPNFRVDLLLVGLGGEGTDRGIEGIGGAEGGLAPSPRFLLLPLLQVVGVFLVADDLGSKELRDPAQGLLNLGVQVSVLEGGLLGVGQLLNEAIFFLRLHLALSLGIVMATIVAMLSDRLISIGLVKLNVGVME